MLEQTSNDNRNTVETELASRVYQACVGFFESLETSGKILGNGHHAAQNVAAAATSELKKRWFPDIVNGN